MGEQADYLTESFLDEDYDVGWEQAGRICKYCKKGPYWWHKTDEGWRLVTETGKVHKCNKYVG